MAIGVPVWAIGSLRPRITLTATELIIRNPLRSRRIQLTELSSVQGGWGGLKIKTSSGDVVVAWAVQKSRYAQWSHKRTRADDIADEIMAAACPTKAASNTAPSGTVDPHLTPTVGTTPIVHAPRPAVPRPDTSAES
jgi:hypothetical protein